MIEEEKLNTRKILVVDDDDRNLRIAEAMLIPLGYEVTVAADGIEALEKVKQYPPDVILLDVMMPKMNGFEVTRILKSDPKTSNIPIVMVTALSSVEDRVKALEVGADDFLSKPIDSIELRARVSSLMKVKAYNDHMVDYQAELEATVAERTRELKEAFNKIKESSLETILRLTRAAECKDNETGNHIKRIGYYTAAIARDIGLDEEQSEHLLYAAPMHDIGKIGIPDRILQKPAKLDDDEWDIMKQHTIIGGNILEGSNVIFIQMAQAIAQTHHEKWDGSGYPNGLKGEQIPLIGRITAVADVFDALISSRPYKESISLDKSLSIIRDGRGTHFDPLVVDSLFRLKEQILTIKDRLNNEEKQ